MVLHRTLIAAAVLAATAPAWASTEEAARAVEEPAQADAAEPASDEGESVVVRDRAGESLTSFTHLTREDIARRPTEDGNITDLLKSNPAVQFSNHGDGSLQMGEIKPSNIRSTARSPIRTTTRSTASRPTATSIPPSRLR